MENKTGIPATARLMAGAKILGSLWKKKIRCKEGWRILWDEGHPDCPCNPMTEFCKAKQQWAMLAIGAGRELEEGPCGIIQMMTVSELDASGVVANAEVTGVGAFRIGTGGNSTAKDLVELAKDPESASHVLSLMKAFPGSKMEFQK